MLVEPVVADASVTMKAIIYWFLLLGRAILYRLGVALTSVALVLAPMTTALTPTNAFAELVTGTQNFHDWCTVVPGYTGDTQDCGYPTPLAACQAQYDYWAHPELFPQIYFRGYNDTPYYWYNKLCDWNWQNGWGVKPTSVIYYCDEGNTRRAPPGGCVRPNENFALRQCSVNGGGSPFAATPFPIDALSGNKLLNVVDFTTREVGLSITRTYNSLPFGPGYSYPYYPFRSPPLGFTNWLPDFAYEIQISDQLLNATGQVGLVAPHGGFYAFKKQTNGSLTAYMGPSSTVVPQLDYTLELLTAWPSNLSTFTNSSSSWRMTDPDDGVWTLETALNPTSGKYDTARPISHTTRGGLTRTFTYGSQGELLSITNQFGRSVAFSWIYSDPEDAGHTGAPVPRAISEIELPNQDRLVYIYEVLGTNETGMQQADRLKTVERRDAGNNLLDETTYLYDDASFPLHITGIEDDGVLRWEVTYDSLGRALTSSAPGGADLYSVSYGAPGTNFTRTVTNPLGRQTIYRHLRTNTNYDVRWSATEGQTSANAPAATASMAYGTNRLLSSTTDEEGRVTSYVRDSRGLETSRTEGYGTPQARTITTTWHATLRLPTQITEPGLTTTFTYDSNGNVLTKTETDTTTQSLPYSTNGQQRTWTYTYTVQNLLDTIDGPLAATGDTVDFDYDVNGLLSKVTDAVGNVTFITSVDDAGRPLTILDANGVATALAYDDLGRLTSITRSPGTNQRQTSLTYDTHDRVTDVTLPTGGTLEYTYDARDRVTEVRNNFDERTTYSYNAAGEVVQRQILNSGSSVQFTQTLAYDEIGRLLEIVGAGAEEESYGYDRTDLPTSRTDPRSMTFTRAYDSVSRVISDTNPEGQSTQYTYDGRNNLATQRDGRALVTTFVRNGFGDAIQESSPDSGLTTFWHDAAGNVVRSLDADSVEMLFTYDDAGRMLTRTYPSNTALNQSFSYDDVTGGNFGKGLPTTIADARGTSSHRYNEFGELTETIRIIDSHSYQQNFSYDTLGNLTVATYPSGREVRYTRDSQGRATSVDSRATSGGAWSGVASNITWRPFGPLDGFTFGNGVTLDLNYDQNYWLTDIDASGAGPAILDLAFTRDDAGAVTAVTDAVAPTRSAAFTYSNSGRLSTATGFWGSLSWLYDAAGNRTQETRASTQFNYTYPSSSNRQSEVRDGANTLVRSFAYRQNGQMAQDDRISAGVYNYDYDAAGRMQQARLNGNVAATYGYDAAGRRITRTVTGAPNTSREYLYFPDGRLMAEADGAGAVLREYLWLEELPLAVVDQNGGSPNTYYIHAGARGEPLTMTNATQVRVWDAGYEPFGAATIFASTTALDLRLPGQQLQAETGLHQNWMRDYDPALGRYVEPDPIGLNGGPNVYSYVGQDPLQYTDPSGLFFPFLWAVGAFLAHPLGRAAVGFVVGFLVDTAWQVAKNLSRGCRPFHRFGWRSATFAGAVGATGFTSMGYSAGGAAPMATFEVAMWFFGDTLDAQPGVPGLGDCSCSPR